MNKNFLIRDIPEDTHREFKLECIRQQIGMNEALIKLMEDFPRDSELKEKQPCQSSDLLLSAPSPKP